MGSNVPGQYLPRVWVGTVKEKKKKAQNHSDWKEASNHIFYSLVYLPSALKLLSRKLALTTLRSNKVSLC